MTTRRYNVDVHANDRTGAPVVITSELDAEYSDEAMDRAEDAATEAGLKPWCSGAIPVPPQETRP